MKRALVALIAGTVLSGLAAAYASTVQRDEPARAKAPGGVAALY
jgi:hypothetical protein